MESNKKIVADFYEAWKTGNETLLHLHPEFQHHSKERSFESRADFMEHCWGKMPAFDNEIISMVAEGEQIVIWYRWENKGMPICEWFKISEGLIREIRVFFG